MGLVKDKSKCVVPINELEQFPLGRGEKVRENGKGKEDG